MKLKLDGYILGPMLHHPIFKKKIRVALESRTLIWVPLLQAMTLNILTSGKMIRAVASLSLPGGQDWQD